MLSRNISKITIKKKDLNLELDELEQAAQLVLDENDIPGTVRAPFSHLL